MPQINIHPLRKVPNNDHLQNEAHNNTQQSPRKVPPQTPKEKRNDPHRSSKSPGSEHVRPLNTFNLSLEFVYFSATSGPLELERDVRSLRLFITGTSVSAFDLIVSLLSLHFLDRTTLVSSRPHFQCFSKSPPETGGRTSPRSASMFTS